MAIVHNFAIWNNKGGVGKSTITFHIASRYAETHPNEDVLVIDLCPQANSSLMLLGGGTNGEQNILNNCVQAIPRTVVGYISTILSSGPRANRPDPSQFTTSVHSFNHNMPQNLSLLCGDGNLEPISSAIVGYANMPAIAPGDNPWVWVHNIFREFINDFALQSEENGRSITVFIDTNPAFGIYTELAIVAADQLICPVNADDSSRTAANAMAILLHGSNPPHPVYGSWTFATKAVLFGVAVPKIHLIVGNRITQYDGAARAFRALSDATANQLYSLFQTSPAFFSQPAVAINNVTDFRDYYSVSLRDFNTCGVVAANQGNLLSRMNGGQYMVHGVNVLLDPRRINDCKDAIDEVIAKL